jgi:hypothetical protein
MQADRAAHSLDKLRQIITTGRIRPFRSRRPARARAQNKGDSPHRRWLWSAQHSSIAADTSVVLVMAVLTVFRAKDRPAPPPTLLLHEDERVVGPNSAGWCCPG